jgi:hypothetical protein
VATLSWLATFVIMEMNHVIMDNWRPGGIGIYICNKTWRSCVYVFILSVSLKDRTIVWPLG